METIREKVFKLLDYCGDIAKNNNNETPSYSAKFSPNNIKRVIISTDGVFVQLHYGVQGYGKSSHSSVYDFVRFSSASLYKEQHPEDTTKKYKPLLSLFAMKNIFSGVEEIILLTKPVNANIPNDITIENDLYLMIRTYDKAGSVEDKIKGRFKRLRYYTVLNLNFENLIQLIKTQPGVLKSMYFSEEGILKPYLVKRIELNTEKDAQTAICTQTGTYRFDADILHEYFIKKREKYIAGVEANAFATYKKNSKDKATADINEDISSYINLVRVYSKFKKIFNSCGSNDLGNIDLHFSFLQLYKFDGMCNIPQQLVSSDTVEDAIKQNKQLIHKCKSNMCMVLSDSLFSALYKLANNNTQFTLAVVLNALDDVTLVIPESSVNNLETLERVYNLSIIRGTKVTTSIINSMWLLCFIFLNRDSENFKNEYITKEFWENGVRG